MAGEKDIDLTLSATLAGDLGVSASATTQRAVSAVSAAIANYCGHPLHRADAVVERVRGFGRPLIQLWRTPILTLTSITFGGTAYTAGTDYEVADADAGQVRRLGGVWPRAGYVPDSVSQSPMEELASSADLVATYNGGWVTPGQNALGRFSAAAVTLPEDIQEAALLWATSLYRSLGTDAFVASESLGSYSVSYFAERARQAMPGVVEGLLAPYRRLRGE